ASHSSILKGSLRAGGKERIASWLFAAMGIFAGTFYIFRPVSRLKYRSLGSEIMYKGQSGMWSWLFHRISGLGILLFLLIHLVDISLLSFGPAVYNDNNLLFDQWELRLLSLSLIAVILDH